MNPPTDLVKGEVVAVKIKGEFVKATYYDWSIKYNMPLVLVEGKVLPRKIFRNFANFAEPAGVTTTVPDTAEIVKIVAVSSGTMAVERAEQAVTPPFPLTMGTRIEWRGGHYDIFNCKGEKLRELHVTDAGHAGFDRAVKTRVED